MKSILVMAFSISILSGICAAKELPEAPSAVMAADAFFIEAPMPAAPAPKLAETKVIDGKFLSLAVISTGSTFADSYTTLFAQQNWLAGKKGFYDFKDVWREL